SMIEDLKSDTSNISIIINNFLGNEDHLQYVLNHFEEGRKNNAGNWAQVFTYTIRMGFADFLYTDRTLQQLKNSGGMRLIRNQAASSGIVRYDAAIKDLNLEMEVLSESQAAYMESGDRVWSFREMFKDQGVVKWQREPVLPVIRNYWTTNEPDDFEYLYNKASHYYYTYFRLRKELNKHKKEATELISLLANEYDLK
ncbi:MAG TPA: hypothetical protein VF144_10785, partial [Chitinophagaceae bacterium]